MRFLNKPLAVVATAAGLLAVPGIAAAADSYAPYARATAIVNADGTIVRSSGVEAVTKIATGQYCVRLDPRINATEAVPVASLSGGADWSAIIHVATTASACGDAARHVLLYTGRSTGGYADQPFRVIVP